MLINVTGEGQQPQIVLLGPGPEVVGSWLYHSEDGLVLHTTDGTIVCVWSGRIGVCDFRGDELEFIE